MAWPAQLHGGVYAMPLVILKLYCGAPCYFMAHGQCINFIPGFLPGVWSWILPGVLPVLFESYLESYLESI